MSRKIDIEYNPEPYEMLEWCDEHLDGPFSMAEQGGWQGPNWMIFHTTTNQMPYYIITSGVFDLEEDAVLFKLRWG